MKLLISALLLSATPLLAKSDDTLLEWVFTNSPHGFDVTPDGTFWINLFQVGKKDDYAVEAENLRDARKKHDSTPQFWVRGYHKKNPEVPYRETKALYRIDCNQKTIQTLTWVAYDAKGKVVGTLGPTSLEYIVPGSYGAAYFGLFCSEND